MIEIRKAIPEDAEKVVDINLICWQTAYKGIIQNSFLKKLEANRDQRIKGFKRMYSGDSKTLVAVKDKTIAGFVSWGKNHVRGGEPIGEIYAIYIHPDFQYLGIGSKLLKEGTAQLVSEGYDRMVIWCLSKNRNQEFYKKTGGTISRYMMMELDGIGYQLTGFYYDLK